MINAKVLSTAAALALVLPLVVPSESFAENPGMRTAAGAQAAVSGGGAGFRGAAAPTFSGRTGPRVATGAWHGGYRGGWGGGYRHYRGGGFGPGLVAGAVVGGALASSAYYDPYYYGYGYGPDYYNDGYYDDGAVAVEAAPGGDDAAYCAQTYRSYDPASGTYLGYDGQRHPCP
jgi:BA14K-like protein